MTNLRLSRRRALQALALLGQPALATVPHDAHHALVQLLRGAAKDWVATGNSYAKEVRKFRQLDAPRAENTTFPKDLRKAYAKEVWKVARQHLPSASATHLQAWRQQLPFAYTSLIDVYADASCSVSHCVALGDDALVAVVQGFRGHQHVAAFMDPGAKAWRYVPGIHCLGRSPNGQWIAQANQKGIAVSGIDLRTQYWFDYPHGNEGTPERLKLKPAANPKEAEVLVPFNASHYTQVTPISPLRYTHLFKNHEKRGSAPTNL